MTKHLLIENATNPFRLQLKVKLCATFLTRLKGLMFTNELGVGEGVLIDEAAESVLNSSIHMLFMNFDIAVIWVDAAFRVVDKVYARKWRPVYKPSRPARYILEIHNSRLLDFHLGDQLVVTNV